MGKYIDVDQVKLTCGTFVDGDLDVVISLRDVRKALQMTPDADVIPIPSNWFQEIAKRLRDYSDGYVWSDGHEILCRTESAANMLADMIELLYISQGENVVVNTGCYDPEEDKRNNEEDRYTGWWYVNLE